MKYCESCGVLVADNAKCCPACGHVFIRRRTSKIACVVLCLFIWPLGVHRFLCGDTTAGIAILIGNALACTVGLIILAPLWLCPLAWLVDLISLCRDQRPIWD